jgi:hypothetical protein
MFERIKRNWASLKRGRPGSRFQDQHDKQRKAGKSGAGRALRIGLGALLLPAGVFFLPAPGPGMIILALGAVLIAREFRLAAKALDQLEVTARRVFGRLRRLWKSHSIHAR